MLWVTGVLGQVLAVGEPYAAGWAHMQVAGAIPDLLARCGVLGALQRQIASNFRHFNGQAHGMAPGSSPPDTCHLTRYEAMFPDGASANRAKVWHGSKDEAVVELGVNQRCESADLEMCRWLVALQLAEPAADAGALGCELSHPDRRGTQPRR